ncbi:hypothetical protein SISSUDRAFT_1037276 [Sistotremastrum suecicum HHB10207 ss-3]|uniref:Uncharacterized protein n=1 Tax=Sistotremastrum suecicum HHB10207 ss-3 TaxID=1314776 RepID=A0A165YD20_9AGAM|nr:hypothetical protein SISSUDRAFT_1037276 [Sistotremastrum suecicum HHB10207 ss-3]
MDDFANLVSRANPAASQYQPAGLGYPPPTTTNGGLHSANDPESHNIFLIDDDDDEPVQPDSAFRSAPMASVESGLPFAGTASGQLCGEILLELCVAKLLSSCLFPLTKGVKKISSGITKHRAEFTARDIRAVGSCKDLERCSDLRSASGGKRQNSFWSTWFWCIRLCYTGTPLWDGATNLKFEVTPVYRNY